MGTGQQKFREPDLGGHVYDGQVSAEGYAVCSACHCHENTKAAANPCTGTMLGKHLTRLSSITEILADPVVDARNQDWD